MISFDVISSAYAQSAGPAGAAGGLMSFLPLILMFGVLYFLAIRPQMKRQKEHKAMIEAIQKGDEVITTGGLLGKISKLDDAYLTLDVATLGDKPVEVLVQRASVQTVLPRGTIKDSR
ncbi:preprotein translocase subunit YajC [Limnobacter litoralis]|uniref:Sec translocon accessory complex subunit YajC n=2 Tax=Burkholderiaceae TaxID=119060 RepID=A0ABQ5YMX0_9BURK|nr:preprotein translocase subunit YajC [Limnobacter litoralis]